MQEKLMNMLSDAWKENEKLKFELELRNREMARQQGIMQLEIDKYKDLVEMYKRMFQILNGECVIDE